MKADLFDYFLPPGLIAQHPVDPRDSSRLMVVRRREGAIGHHRFRDLPDFLGPGDLLVLNETRVIPARLHARRQPGGGWIEILLIAETEEKNSWKALLRPVRRVRTGNRLLLPDTPGWFELRSKGEYGLCLLEAHFSEPVSVLMAQHGETPLPPYIKRLQPEEEPEDRERYQTVYARHPGSIAAPTAGLHFTPEVLERLARKQVETCCLTLHVGPATFQPLRAGEVEQHLLPPEKVHIPDAAARAIRQARQEGRRVIAVGTTTTRALESSAARHDGEVTAGDAWADLYIHPPYRFRVVDGLVTNFHLPRSSLLILVCSFGGREFILECYRQAMQSGYRFYSYGDGMVIL